MVSDKKIFMGISHRALCLIKFGCGGHLGRRSEMPDTILEGGHPRTIPPTFGSVVLEGLINMQKANDRRTTDAQ